MKSDQDKVPSSIEQAVDMIVDTLDDEDRETIKNMNSSSSVHHFVGRFLRNSWSLWKNDTPLKRDAVATYGIAHADDISGLILEWVWCRVRGVEFDPHAHAATYHKHWGGKAEALKAGGC